MWVRVQFVTMVAVLLVLPKTLTIRTAMHASVVLTHQALNHDPAQEFELEKNGIGLVGCGGKKYTVLI